MIEISHLISHCYDRQVASLSVITMAYQVRNLDHFLKFWLTGLKSTVPSLPSLEVGPSYTWWLCDQLVQVIAAPSGRARKTVWYIKFQLGI